MTHPALDLDLSPHAEYPTEVLADRYVVDEWQAAAPTGEIRSTRVVASEIDRTVTLTLRISKGGRPYASWGVSSTHIDLAYHEAAVWCLSPEGVDP